MAFHLTSRSRWARLLSWLSVLLLVMVGIGFSAVFIEQPIYGVGLVVAIASLCLFLRSFEQTVLCILLLRSVLDFYSSLQLPAMFALGVDLLVVIYVAQQLILRKPVHTDRFWWFLLAWVLVQGVWVVLLPIGGLGGTSAMLGEAVREWVRFFSLALVYLLTMQLRDRIAPQRLATLLLICLVIPLAFALLQSLPIELPGFLQSNLDWQGDSIDGESGDRINSTLGHYNSFATFSLLFFALSLWRLQIARRPFGWLLLSGAMLYCVLASKSLAGLIMLFVFLGLYFLPKLRGKSLLGALALAVILAILLSSDLGQSRLAELDKTPLLNPDLSFSDAMALQAADITEFRNSFNWRLLQWRDLLLDWQIRPWLGYGLASAKALSPFDKTSHNDYVRFLVEEGIVGFSLFLLFLMAQVARTVQAMRQSLPGSPQRALAQAMFAFAIAMIVGMSAGNVMVHTATFFYWWVLMALLDWPWPQLTGLSQGRLDLPLANLSLEAQYSNEPYSDEPYLEAQYSEAQYPEGEALYLVDPEANIGQNEEDVDLVQPYLEDIYHSDRYLLESDPFSEYPVEAPSTSAVPASDIELNPSDTVKKTAQPADARPSHLEGADDSTLLPAPSQQKSGRSSS
ncbi:MAG: O-antigen ligase family protein [Phormidesmis sp.]